MTPALASLLLAVPYFVVGLGITVLAWAAGGFVYAALTRHDASDARPWQYSLPGAGMLQLLIRVAGGFALFSWIAAVLGVIGVFKLPLLLGILLLIIMLGFFTGARVSPPHRPALLRDQLFVGQHWVAATSMEKAFVAAILFVFSAITVNAIIGAMVPDMNQDPMWYHLPMPQQWVFDGQFNVYPNLMPSAYPVAAESLFAIIFSIGGNAVMCSLLTALCGVGYLVTIVTAAWASLGSEDKSSYKFWGVGAVLGICVPLLVAYGLLAPIQPKNDMIMCFWACTGAMAIYVPLMGARQAPARGWWAVGGFLLGTAICAKPTAINMVFFLMVFAVPLAIYSGVKSGRKSVGRVLIDVVICGVMMLMAAVPWLTRGWLAHGVPTYPLGTSLFVMSPEFSPLQHGLRNIQAVPGLGISEWVRKFMEFPSKLSLGANHGEKMIFLYLISAITGIIATRGRWRWFSISLLFHLVLIIGYTGAVEVFRYFSPSYLLATPLIALLVSRAVPRLGPGLRYAVAALVWLAVVGSMADLQMRTAMTKTMDWGFRPVLSSEDVELYAEHAEMGWTYHDFGLIRDQIDKRERVFLLGATYPYYLHRNTLWNDEAVREGGIADRWAHMTPREAVELLRREKIDVVLYASGADKIRGSGSPVPGLVDQGVLQKVKIPRQLEDKGWAFYRVDPRVL